MPNTVYYHFPWRHQNNHQGEISVWNLGLMRWSEKSHASFTLQSPTLVLENTTPYFQKDKCKTTKFQSGAGPGSRFAQHKECGFLPLP